MWLRRDNKITKRYCLRFVNRERYWPYLLVYSPVSWQLLHSRLTTFGDSSSLRATTRSISSCPSSCITMTTSEGPNIVRQHHRQSAITNDTENKNEAAHVLPTWLINDSTSQSFYRGVDARTHLAALSSRYKSFNHDFLCTLHNPPPPCTNNIHRL